MQKLFLQLCPPFQWRKKIRTEVDEAHADMLRLNSSIFVFSKHLARSWFDREINVLNVV